MKFCQIGEDQREASKFEQPLLAGTLLGLHSRAKKLIEGLQEQKKSLFLLLTL